MQQLSLKELLQETAALARREPDLPFPEMLVRLQISGHQTVRRVPKWDPQPQHYAVLRMVDDIGGKGPLVGVVASSQVSLWQSWSLSRTLRTLAEHHLIEKTHQGYWVLTHLGVDALDRRCHSRG